jgi:hypothetical protein
LIAFEGKYFWCIWISVVIVHYEAGKFHYSDVNLLFHKKERKAFRAEWNWKWNSYLVSLQRCVASFYTTNPNYIASRGVNSRMYLFWWNIYIKEDMVCWKTGASSLWAAWLLHSVSTFSFLRPFREMLFQSAGDCTLDMLLQMLIKSSQVQLYIPTFVKVIMTYRVSFRTFYRNQDAARTPHKGYDAVLKVRWWQ